MLTPWPVDIFAETISDAHDFLCSLLAKNRLGKRKSSRHVEDSSTTKAGG